MKFDVHNYDDIINMKKPKSNHIPMDNIQRAAQFAPYAALTGFDEEINETARIVDKKIELSEDKKSELSFKLTYLQEHIKEDIEIQLTYFIKDSKKQGGKYQTITTSLKRIDNPNRIIELKEKQIIKISNIYEIKSECFKTYEYDIDNS